MRFASFSVSDLDTGEALEELLDRAGAFDEPIHFAAVFFGPAHVAEASRIGEAILDRLEPRLLIGCSAEYVLGGGREFEEPGGISLLLGFLPGAKILPIRLDPEDFPLAGAAQDSILEQLGVTSGANTNSKANLRAILGVAEPFTFPVNHLLDLMNARLPGVPLLGGIASAARAPGNNRLLLDDQIFEGGFIGLSVSGNVRVDAVVSQGCRPIWQPLVVTRSDGHTIAQLGGRPALRVLQGFIEAMNEDEKLILGKGLMIGRAVNEYREQFGVGDFLVRNILGVSEEQGAFGVADRCRVGTTVQFHVRDAQTAHDDLISHLQAAAKDGSAAGGLLVTCNGRGTRMFESTGHDVDAIEQIFPGTPIAGFFAAGEFGPFGGRNYMHGHTACLALFRPM